jgi:hypothetical protein
MQEINLLQGKYKDTTYAWERHSRVILSVLSIILIGLLVATAMFFLLERSTQRRIDSAKTAGAELQRQLNEQQAEIDEAKVFQAQTSNIKTLLNNHVYATPLLNELSTMTFIRSQYINFDATVAGRVHLEGNVPDYQQQLSVFNRPASITSDI